MKSRFQVVSLNKNFNIDRKYFSKFRFNSELSSQGSAPVFFTF